MEAMDDNLKTESRSQLRADLSKHTRAITGNRLEAAELHASRAVCHEKLGDLEAAWQDARMTVRLAEDNPHDYTNAIAILLKIDRFSTTTDLLEYARKQLEECQQSSPLTLALDALRRPMRDTTPRDPLVCLPDELKLAMLSLVDFRTLIKLREVSRTWRDFINKTPELWQRLDVGGITWSGPLIKHDFIQRAVEAAQNRVTDVVIGRLEDPQRSLALLLEGYQLKSVSIRAVFQIPWEQVAASLERSKSLRQVRVTSNQDPFGEDHVIRLIFTLRHQLRVISYTDRGDFHPFRAMHPEPIIQWTYPELKQLHLTSWRPEFTGMINGGPETVAARFPKLKELDLALGGTHAPQPGAPCNEDFQGFHQLQTLRIHGEWHELSSILLPRNLISLNICTARPLQTLPSLPTGLRSLVLNSVPDEAWSLMQLPQLEDVSLYCEDLRKLALSLLPADYDLSKHSPRLRRLRICGWRMNGCDNDLLLAGVCHHPRLKNLLNLEIVDIFNTLDGGITRVDFPVEQLKHLEYISFDGCRMDDSVILAAIRAPKLKKLHPGDVEQLSFDVRTQIEVFRVLRWDEVPMWHDCDAHEVMKW